jgi:hypothetical protein
MVCDEQQTWPIAALLKRKTLLKTMNRVHGWRE